MVVAEGLERVDVGGLLWPLRALARPTRPPFAPIGLESSPGGDDRALHRHGALAGGPELPRQVGHSLFLARNLPRRLSEAGRRLSTTCIKQVGLNQTCGVHGCYCDTFSDLLCDDPPLPESICIKVTRPLCAAAGTNVTTSGMRSHLFNLFLASIVLSAARFPWFCLDSQGVSRVFRVFSSIFQVLNFLIWTLNACAMLLTWLGYQMRNSKAVTAPVQPDVECPGPEIQPKTHPES